MFTINIYKSMPEQNSWQNFVEIYIDISALCFFQEAELETQRQHAVATSIELETSESRRPKLRCRTR